MTIVNEISTNILLLTGQRLQKESVQERLPSKGGILIEPDLTLKVQPSSSAAEGIDSERVAGKTIITLYLYFLVILIEFFIVID